ncbi:TraR/DksA family transcriptional regulator [Streptomyces sp. NBC_01571]|uniref:TraR/DksA family transcriptional regulator n=1 Tax=Streptomyces sp. NBC_01571 TaxID=2975883 RepID=UPI002250E7CB|nr:TraR/DksA family transcriptional regulator [Streptomyces sp. NBC_01571]MCX4574414.1 TraR/DksA family transcriptional regulator [Streptomyces sp. NBC_01571]
MVAKKTAVQQSASGRSTGPAAKDVSGKKSAQRAPAEHGSGIAPVSTAAGRTGTKKTVAEKTATKRAVAEKSVPEEPGPAADATAKGAPKRAARSAAGKSSGTAKKATGAAKKSTGTATKNASRTKKTAASAAEDAARAAKTTGAPTVVAKKTPGTATAAGKPTALPKARISAVEPGELAVRPGEDPWTPQEVADARAELQSEALRLSTEITSSEESLAGLMRDSGDGAGDDQADTGTKNITRESEMALAANAREMLVQTERALEKLDAGTYGLCENCGDPIGKARMQAFPRATLCVECKQKQERR